MKKIRMVCNHGIYGCKGARFIIWILCRITLEDVCMEDCMNSLECWIAIIMDSVKK